MGEYNNGELYIYQNFFEEKLKVAGRFQANLMQYTIKNNFIPSGAPASQVYDLEISYKLTDNIIINMTEGCKHYFEQSNYSEKDKWIYLKIGLKYEF